MIFCGGFFFFFFFMGLEEFERKSWDFTGSRGREIERHSELRRDFLLVGWAFCGGV